MAGSLFNTPATQLTEIERDCSTNGIYYTRSSFSCISVVSNSTSSSSHTNLYPYYPTLSTPPRPSLSSRQNFSLFLAAPTDSRPVICHVRQEFITLRCRIDGLPSLIANINHGSNPLRYLTLVRPRQSSTDLAR